MIAQFGTCEVDFDRVELRRADELVPIEPQVFDVLSYLIEHRDRMVTKEELLDNIWGDRFVSESALTSRIKSARHAVGDNGRDQAVIKTVHGRGYRFVAPVEIADLAISAANDAPRMANHDAGVSVVGPTGGSDAPDLDDRWPLVGRRDALEHLQRSFEEHRVAGVLLTGPAGIGKTRLAREFVGWAAAAGTPTVHVSGLAESSDVALAAVSHVLPPDVLAVGTHAGDLGRAMVFQRARAVFADLGAGDRTIVLVEDANFLDEDTAALIGSLLTANSVFAVLTQRAAPGDPLALDELIRSGHVHQLELAPLDDTDLDVLLYRVLQGPIDVQSLQRLTHLTLGRPGALQQLVETSLESGALARDDGAWRLRDPVPAGAGRPGSGGSSIDDLTSAELAGAELLAIAGELSLDLATELIGADVVDALDRAGMLALDEPPSGPRVSIVHVHVALLLLDRIGPLRSRRHKRRLVEALADHAEQLTPDDRLRIVTWMIETGTDPEHRDVLDAATHAVRMVDTTRAELLLDHLDRTAPGPDAMQLRAKLAFRLGRVETARRLLDELEHADLDPDDAAAVTRRRATIRFHLDGRYDDALELLRDAGAGAEGGHPTLTTHAIGLHGFLGDAGRVGRLVDSLPNAPTGPAALECLRGRAQAAVARGSYTEALALIDEHDGQLAGLDPTTMQTFTEVALATRIDAIVGAGELRRAFDLLRVALPVGQRTLLAWLPLAAARAHLAAGRPRAARELVVTRHARARSEGLVHADPLISGLLGQAAARLGDAVAARSLLDRAEAPMAALTGNLRWTVASSVADAAIELGDRAHAVEVASASLDDATGRGAVAVAADLAATAAVAGDLDSGERAVELASGLDGVLWPLRARHVAALVESKPDALADVASGYRVLGYERLATLADTAVRSLPRAGERHPRA